MVLGPKLDLNLKPHKKIKLEWIIDLNVRTKNIGHLEENIGAKFQGFFYIVPKAQVIKENLDKLEFINLENIVLQKTSSKSEKTT